MSSKRQTGSRKRRRAAARAAEAARDLLVFLIEVKLDPAAAEWVWPSAAGKLAREPTEGLGMPGTPPTPPCSANAPENGRNVDFDVEKMAFVALAPDARQQTAATERSQRRALTRLCVQLRRERARRTHFTGEAS